MTTISVFCFSLQALVVAAVAIRTDQDQQPRLGLTAMQRWRHTLVRRVGYSANGGGVWAEWRD